jgi:hypothetical protein
MMTVSGIAAKGLSPDFIIRRKAAKCACPQLAAVLGTDTELRFAVIPVILFLLLYRVSGYKGIKFPSSGNEIFHVFFCKELLRETTLSQYLPIPQNTYRGFQQRVLVVAKSPTALMEGEAMIMLTSI